MLEALRRDLQPKFLFPSLTIGLVAGIENALMALAYAVMIFAGDLTPAIGIGATVFFVGSIIYSTIGALGSPLPGMQTSVQDGPAVILAVVTASMLAGMPTASFETKFYTALGALMAAGLLTGLICLLLGNFKLGNLVSYLPYPVVGGFLAGSGLLMVLGALQVMTGRNITLCSLGLLFQPDAWLHWLPGVAFAIVLFVLVMKVGHYLVLPAVLAATIGLFYLVLAFSGASPAAAAADGWLVSGISPGGALFRWWNPSGFAQVDWGALLGQTGSLLACVIVSLLSLLLNITALELSTGQEIDLNAELKNNGWANLLGGAAGSVIGYPQLGATSLAYRLGAPTRLSALLNSLFTALILLVGGGLMGYFPNLVLGGMLFFIGLDFLYSWLYRTWFTMPRLDYAIVVGIMLMICTIGFLEGVGLGLALAVGLFLVQYSRTKAVRHTLSGVSYQSSVDRARLQTQLLRRKGDWLYILELQGFLFFGTANQVLEQARARLEGANCLPAPRFILLDFRLVTGIDSSAVFSFTKILRLAQAHDASLGLAHLSPQARKQLEKELPEGRVQYFPDLDRGIEWCEEAMVATFESVGLAGRRGVSLFRQLARTLPGEGDIEILQSYLRRREYQPGECIICQGAPQGGLYMIESGLVRVQMECEDGASLRLRSLGTGSFFGEMGLYSGEPAAADVAAEEATVVYELSKENLARMEAEAPALAAALHRFVVAYMSERLAKLTTTVQALLG